MLFPCEGMCYKRRTVERAAKQEVAPVRQGPAQVAECEGAAPRVEQAEAARGEDASRYCPVCSQRLESRQCKLICPVCGYYMSCADYY